MILQEKPVPDVEGLLLERAGLSTRAGLVLRCTHHPEENVMPWYAWSIIILALGSIVGGLLLLRDSARPLPLSEEQLKRIHARNAEQEAKDAEER